ncbi:hypothetical protein B7463_g349, partial [Scytalidium lignicola]
MGTPQENTPEDDQFPPDSIDTWHCPICFKVIDPSRPPVLNWDNCCCKELGPATRKPTEYLQQDILAYEQSIAQLAHMSLNRSESCSSASVKAPEGPERQLPTSNDISAAYLPLAPAPGNNERQHRLSSDSRDSFAMSCFIVEKLPRFLAKPSSGACRPATSEFLPQAVHIQSQFSNKATKGTKESQYGEQSFGMSDWSGSFHACQGDATMHIGAWADGQNDYPSYMSDSILLGSDSEFLG